MSATAAVAVGPLATELQEFPLPQVGPDDGLLAVEACGVCGTDWEFYLRETRGAGMGSLILGHEDVGRVAAIGERAAERWDVTVGDRIALEEFIPCHHCALCLSGRHWLCEATDSRSLGPFLRYGCTPTTVGSGLWGGFAEMQYLHPNSLVHKLPDELDAEVASMFVPVANGLRWVLDEAALAAGGSVLVIGPGQHGLGCVIAAKEGDAETIAVSGLAVDRARLEMARTLGAGHTIEADREALVDRGREITDGRGFDVIVDLAPGAADVVSDAVALLARGGTLVLAGSKHGLTTPVSADQVIAGERIIRGVRGRDFASVERALRIMASGRHPLAALCTHAFGLSEVDMALRLLGDGRDPGAIHVTVLPQSERG